MPRIDVIRQTRIQESARIAQIRGMFDVPQRDVSAVEWSVDFDIDFEWNIGLITGASGSGKTTIARELFKEKVISGFEWDNKKSILDNFPAHIETSVIVDALCQVGFGTAPHWLRPYSVLSNGEQFRATMARALIENDDSLTVIDEFTSVIDRQVAKVASHTIQKYIRKNQRRFIAVSCHEDIIDWLQPDLIYYPESNHFARRYLQRRPDINVAIHEIDHSAWKYFSKYHYMSAELHFASKCFGAFIENKCVGFAAYLHFPHPIRKNIKIAHRIVILPDYQGLGIGVKINDWIGEYLASSGFEYRMVIAHPAFQHYCASSPRWRCVRLPSRLSAGGRDGKISMGMKKKQREISAKRATASFVYVPENSTGSTIEK